MTKLMHQNGKVHVFSFKPHPSFLQVATEESDADTASRTATTMWTEPSHRSFSSTLAVEEKCSSVKSQKVRVECKCSVLQIALTCRRTANLHKNTRFYEG